MKRFYLLLIFFLMAGTRIITAQLHCTGHPGPQLPRPAFSSVSNVGDTTFVQTGQSCFDQSDPFNNPPGTNFLGPTVESDALDGTGAVMPNTLPSLANGAFNLLEGGGPTSVVSISQTSPTDDLTDLLNAIVAQAQQNPPFKDSGSINFAISILEGDNLPARPQYSGLPLLHYTGPEKGKQLVLILDAFGNVVDATVDVKQVWFDQHIESDTAFLDWSPAQEMPFHINYRVNVLHRGNDDFSPYIMYFDAPPPGADPKQTHGLPHISMDQTFYQMFDANQYTFNVKYSKGKYYNLVYTWGWRRHPPRVQVIESAFKKAPYTPDATPQPLQQFEVDVFGGCPRCSSQNQLNAIAQIGELAPAKRMWLDLVDARNTDPAIDPNGFPRIIADIQDAIQGLTDFNSRNQLPTGVQADPNADLTLFYVNNTIYGSGRIDFQQWTTRPGHAKITLLNGDHYIRAYQSVDFGGERGWENQFQNSFSAGDPDLNARSTGATGCFFTFGRDHWWVNVGYQPPVPQNLVTIPPVTTNPNTGQQTPGVHHVDMTFNFDPSPRLRFYNFDTFHHDVAVYSLH